MREGLTPLRSAALLALGVLAGAGAIGALVWADLDAGERASLAAALHPARSAFLLLLALCALAALVGFHYLYAARWHDRAVRIAESLAILMRANPARRVDIGGPAPLAAVAHGINELATHRARLMTDRQVAVEKARADVERERNRFAALVSELEQSVLVCNRDGRILLYNHAAKALLSAGDAAAGAGVGLGRTVYKLFDRALLQHAFEAVEERLQRGERPGVQFVTSGSDGRQLRLQVAAIGETHEPAPGAPPAAAAVSGYVLLLTDVTANVERDARSVRLFQELVERTRGAIGSIRAAIETILGHPDMALAERERCAGIVQGEAARLAERLDELGADVSERLHQRWPLEDMRGADLLALVCRRIEREAAPRVRRDPADAQLWLRVDSFSLVQAVAALALRLHNELGVRDVRLRVAEAGTHGQLDLSWLGVPMSSETAYAWQNDAYSLGGGDNPMSLAQVMERHGGEAWYLRDAPTQTNHFRMRLPLAGAPARAPAPAAEPSSRTEFYDFELLQRRALHERLGGRRLADLSFTVFDTETTGLDPACDELIAIGAVRIVNGRLLRSETFETLVQSRRPPSPASVAIHGITRDQLAGQPPIEQVLPRFWRFCEDTVLVGHNVAFDRSFLKELEAPTGIRFAQPALDTLLLGACVQPAEATHTLEALAERMGVPVSGRHSALGDAMMTARIFLALMPLLDERGIHTLDEALQASERTPYSKVTY